MDLRADTSHGQRVGYVRVSTREQHTDRQLHEKTLDGLNLERIFRDTASGKDLNRPGLKDCLAYLREGDTLVCHSLDRLSRSLVDLNNLINSLTSRGVRVQFMSESLTFTGEKNSLAELQLNIMGAVAQFERSNLLQRQREGIDRAKEKGTYKNCKRRGPKVKPDDQKQIIHLVLSGEMSVAKVASRYNIARQTVYSYLAKAGVERKVVYADAKPHKPHTPYTPKIPSKYSALEL